MLSLTSRQKMECWVFNNIILIILVSTTDSLQKSQRCWKAHSVGPRNQTSDRGRRGQDLCPRGRALGSSASSFGCSFLFWGSVWGIWGFSWGIVAVDEGLCGLWTGTILLSLIFVVDFILINIWFDEISCPKQIISSF